MRNGMLIAITKLQTGACIVTYLHGFLLHRMTGILNYSELALFY